MSERTSRQESNRLSQIATGLLLGSLAVTSCGNSAEALPGGKPVVKEITAVDPTIISTEVDENGITMLKAICPSDIPTTDDIPKPEPYIIVGATAKDRKNVTIYNLADATHTTPEQVVVDFGEEKIESLMKPSLAELQKGITCQNPEDITYTLDGETITGVEGLANAFAINGLDIPRRPNGSIDKDLAPAIYAEAFIKSLNNLDKITRQGYKDNRFFAAEDGTTGSGAFNAAYATDMWNRTVINPEIENTQDSDYRELLNSNSNDASLNEEVGIYDADPNGDRYVIVQGDEMSFASNGGDQNLKNKAYDFVFTVAVRDLTADDETVGGGIKVLGFKVKDAQTIGGNTTFTVRDQTDLYQQSNQSLAQMTTPLWDMVSQ